MSSVDVVDVVRLELLGRQSERHGAVVGERADRRMRPGESTSQRGEPDRVEEAVEGDAVVVELGGDGPILTAGAVGRAGSPDVGLEQGV